MGRIRHQVDRCLMTKELICDEIAVGDNREVRSVSIHTHQRDSPHPAHAHCGQCLVHYQICTKQKNPDIIRLAMFLIWMTSLLT